MNEFQSLPTFQSSSENPLALFLADLRGWVFSSQARAATYFGLDRSTVWRYEEGRTLPPSAYLVELAHLVAERLGDQRYADAAYRELLLQEINRALVSYYPNEQPFRTWNDALRTARKYYTRRASATSATTREPVTSSPPAQPAGRLATHIDWGDAPEVAVFYGRRRELATLQQLLTSRQCRLLGVFGMGGAGKTVLAARLVETIADQFDAVCWRSLVNAPPPGLLFRELFQHFADPTALRPAVETLQPHDLLPLLQSRRCLIVLDNFETLLDNQGEGGYRAGYEACGRLLQLLGEARHQSCVLLTSREKPREMIALESAVKNTGRVRAFNVPGLDIEDAREMLQTAGLQISTADLPALLLRCSGNPKILEIVAAAIRDFFDGSVTTFLADESIIFDDVRDILQTQFDRLSSGEQEVMFWLALAREHVSIAELRQFVLNSDAGEQLLHTVRSLQRRSLVETDLNTLYLQNAVAEYVGEVLIQRLHSELLTGRLLLLHHFALIRARARDYVRASQERVLLRALAERLLQHFSPGELAGHIDALLGGLRESYGRRPSYAAGNLINLLRQIGADLGGRDFSQLAIWQAYLRGLDLNDASFADSDLRDAVFNETFGSVRAVAFSPNGALLAAGSSNGEIHVWQVHSREHLYTLEGYAWVEAIAFSPDSRILASGSHEPAIQLWDMLSGECIGTLAGHTTTVRTLSFNAEGTLLASGSDDSTLRLWDVAQFAAYATLRGHQGTVWSAAFHPDAGLLISAGSDEIVLWDLGQLRELQRLRAHQAAVMTMAISPDGRTMASGSYDGLIKLWSLPDAVCYATLENHRNAIRALAFSPDGSLLASGSEDQSIRFWNPHNGQQRDIIYEQANRVRAMAFSPDGSMLASGSHDQNLRLWHVASRQCLLLFQGYINQLRSMALSPDGRQLALGVAERISLMDVESGKIVRHLWGHGEWVQSLNFNSDGSWLASSSDDHTARLWPLEQNAALRCVSRRAEPRILAGHESWVQSIVFSPDGHLAVTCSIDRSIRIWDTASGACLRVLRGHEHHIWALAVSPDGRWLASGGADQRIRLWDIQRGECRHILDGHSGSVWSLAFTNDSARLVSCGHDHFIRLWQVAEARLEHSLAGHSNRVISVAVSPNGRLVASGGDDRSLRIWDLRSGKCLRTLPGHQRPIVRVVFSPDSSLVYSGSEDGSVRVWDISGDICIRVLVVPRPYDGMDISGTSGLTPAQRASLVALGAVDRLS